MTAMTLIELECRLSWINAAIRHTRREVCALATIHSEWLTYHEALSWVIMGGTFFNA
jgi:hypothetical protein